MLSACKDCKHQSRAARVLAEEELSLMMNHCAVLPFRTGEILVRKGVFATQVAYLKKGIVKIYDTGSNGSEHIVNILPEGSYIDLHTVLTDRHYRYFASSLTDGEICYIEAPVFRELMLSNSRFCYQLALYLSRDELDCYRRLISMGHSQVAGRLAGFLLWMSEDVYKSETFECPLTRSEVASYLGARRESITRVLKEFEQAGWVRLTGRVMKILNKEKLLQIEKYG
ncbi:MAG: hypothetical protein Kow00127_04380 [Bacteroidales bacterium]